MAQGVWSEVIMFHKQLTDHCMFDASHGQFILFFYILRQKLSKLSICLLSNTID
jgi:hypothetical protein